MDKEYGSGFESEVMELLDERARGEVLEFMRGDREEFSRALIEKAFEQGGTEFQREVWRAIGRIPYGEVATYGQIAAMIGRPLAVRAVGTACGKNKWPVIIPCHRVVAQGGIGGYGYGLELKRRLLAVEGVRYE